MKYQVGFVLPHTDHGLRAVEEDLLDECFWRRYVLFLVVGVDCLYVAVKQFADQMALVQVGLVYGLVENLHHVRVAVQLHKNIDLASILDIKIFVAGIFEGFIVWCIDLLDRHVDPLAVLLLQPVAAVHSAEATFS